MRHLMSFMEIIRLKSEMNKLFEALQRLGSGRAEEELGFTPPYDIVESSDGVFIEMDLPGVDPSSLKISVRGATVAVEGEKRTCLHHGAVAYHLMERDRGRFTRHLRVEGAYNTHKGEAEYAEGVLIIRMPRVEDRRGTAVTIPVKIRP
jgi:HSP20 family protein